MVINILIGLIILLFLIIGGLFALVLKPEWQSYIKNWFHQSDAVEQTQVESNTSDTPVSTNQPSIEEFKTKLHNIQQNLAQVKSNFSNLYTNGINEFEGKIDNINTYLKELTSDDIHILDVIENNLHRIDFASNSENKNEKSYAELSSISNFLYYYQQANKSYSEQIEIFYKNALSELSRELNKFRKLKDILANASTIQVYEIDRDKHHKSHRHYLFFFFLSIASAFAFAYFSITLKAQIAGDHNINIIDYWILKASGVFIFITLITFFLKQAIHHQKKRDQIERTMLELKALPSYLNELKSEDATNLRKDLASKYFGNSADGSTLNEIGNIITEQLKNSTEVAKSSAEIIKTLHK